MPVLAVVIFLVLLIGTRLLGGLAARALHGVGLGGLDRLLGGALGVLRAGIIILLVALVAHLNGMSAEPAWQQAWSKPLLDRLVYWAEPFLPERLSGIRQT
jgi:membrane protein required for colicin V production